MRSVLLALCGAVYGVATGWMLRRYSDPAALRKALNRSLAHILEFRLFIDEPRLIIRAQGDLVRANVALLRAMAGPLVAALALLAIAWVPLQSQFGQAAMEVGDIRLARVESVTTGIDLVAPFGVAIETPALRLPGESQTVWRVRVLSPVSGEFQTRPRGVRVTIDSRPATYWGVSWLWSFGLASMLGSAVAWRRYR